jgi:GT2 family glycosyltransferase
MLISRDALAAVGLLPECYFPAYMEDAEYSVRACRAGFPVIYAPRVIAYHKVGASLGLAAVTPRVAYALNRHRGFYVRRNMTGWTRAAALGYLILTKPGRAALETIRGRPRIGWAVFTGFLAGLFSLSARA